MLQLDTSRLAQIYEGALFTSPHFLCNFILLVYVNTNELVCVGVGVRVCVCAAARP